MIYLCTAIVSQVPRTVLTQEEMDTELSTYESVSKKLFTTDGM